MISYSLELVYGIQGPAFECPSCSYDMAQRKWMKLQGLLVQPLAEKPLTLTTQNSQDVQDMTQNLVLKGSHSSEKSFHSVLENLQAFFCANFRLYSVRSQAA